MAKKRKREGSIADAGGSEAPASEEPSVDSTTVAGEAGPEEGAEEPEATDAASASDAAASPASDDASAADGDERADETKPVSRRKQQEELYRKARDLAEEGKLRDAARAYAELLAINPRHLKARNNLGFVYDRLGEPELALKEYRGAAELDP